MSRTPWDERFWSKVTKTDSCWEWTAYCGDLGYGRFWLDGGPRLAHVVSFELHHGPLKDDEEVRHTCDNRACVNPEHLIRGSRRDNMVDMAIRNRCPTRKLSRDSAAMIIEAQKSGATPTEAARAVGCKFQQAWDIFRGRTWKWLREEIEAPGISIF
jgi:hypothetical protein